MKSIANIFRLYVLFLAMISLSIVLMPVVGSYDRRFYSVTPLVGIIFYVGLIGVIVSIILINKKRKAYGSKFNKKFDLFKCGMFSFFQNKIAMIFDIIMMGAFAIMVVLFIMYAINVYYYFKTIYFLFVVISIFIFSFGMHCMLNGVNYRYFNNKKNGEN